MSVKTKSEHGGSLQVNTKSLKFMLRMGYRSVISEKEHWFCAPVIFWIKKKTSGRNSPRFGRAGGGRTHTVSLPGDFKSDDSISTVSIWYYYVSVVPDLVINMSIVSIISMLWYSICTQTAHNMKKERRAAPLSLRFSYIDE